MDEPQSASNATTTVAEPPETDDLKKVGSSAGSHDYEGEAAVAVVADNPRKATPEDMQDALDWFLSDQETETDPRYTIQVNVSTDVGQPKWLEWVIKPIASERIDFLRRTFTMPVNRAMSRRGQQGELDGAKFNAALVFEATVSPDLSIPLAQKSFADGSQLVIHRFRNKPLLVDQIAGQVLFYSGGDDEDVRTAREVRAVKNS